MMETMYKIQTLEKLIDSGMDDGLIDKTLGKLIQYKTDKMERELQELKDSMKNFESRYNMDSKMPYKKFGEGGLGDKKDRKMQIDATDRQIDQVVYELYGLTEGEIKVVEGSVK